MLRKNRARWIHLDGWLLARRYMLVSFSGCQGSTSTRLSTWMLTPAEVAATNNRELLSRQPRPRIASCHAPTTQLDNPQTKICFGLFPAQNSYASYINRQLATIRVAVAPNRRFFLLNSPGGKPRVTYRVGWPSSGSCGTHRWWVRRCGNRGGGTGA